MNKTIGIINTDNIDFSIIEKTNWVQFMKTVPKTLKHFDLLVFFLDKLDICKQYDLTYIQSFDEQRLDILYATLRLINHYFCVYNEYCYDSILGPFYTKLFGDSYDLVFDQLTQDSEYFVANMIKKFYPKLEYDTISLEYQNHLKSIIQYEFYQKFISVKTDDNIEKTYTKILTTFSKRIDKVILELISSANIYLDDIYELSNEIIGKIFDDNEPIKSKNIDKIIQSLINNNIDDIFDTECIEIERYYEELINDDSDTDINHGKLKLNRSMEFMNDAMQNNITHNGYDIVNTYQSTDYTESILHPFLYYKLVSNSDILTNKVLTAMIDNKMTIKNNCVYDFYNQLNTGIGYEDVISYITSVKKFPDNLSVEFIYRILSNILNINIRLFDSTMFTIKSSPSGHSTIRTINIYLVRFNNGNIISLCLEKYKKPISISNTSEISLSI